MGSFFESSLIFIVNGPNFHNIRDCYMAEPQEAGTSELNNTCCWLQTLHQEMSLFGPQLLSLWNVEGC